MICFVVPLCDLSATDNAKDIPIPNGIMCLTANKQYHMFLASIIPCLCFN